VHPELLKSIQIIYAYRLLFVSKKDEILDNFKRSIRGSIRRPPNIMTWVVVLTNLKKHGEDAASVVRQHNAQNARLGQLVGAKAQAVKNILDSLPSEALAVVVSHVQRLGWDDCVFSDDSLSSKKYLPGH